MVHGANEAGIILGMGSATERRRYIESPSLIGWAHSQNDLWWRPYQCISIHIHSMYTGLCFAAFCCLYTVELFFFCFFLPYTYPSQDHFISIGTLGLSVPDPCQAIISTKVGILPIGPLGINISKILMAIQTFSFKKVHFNMSAAKMLVLSGLQVLSPFRTHWFNELQLFEYNNQVPVS